MSGIIQTLLGPVLDKLIPDADKRKEAKIRLMELEQRGEFAEDEMRLDAIMSEANSEDKWTSRARPAFLYVIYIFLLSGIPFGIAYVFSPEEAVKVTEGMTHWFEAIPDSIISLFGVGYLGYVGARSVDKRTKEKTKEKVGLFGRIFGKKD